MHVDKEDCVKMLEQEGKLLFNLKHSYIVQLLSVTGSPESPVLLMERMWVSLNDFLDNKDFHHDKVAILQDVASGLSYIHDKGIVHCNVTANSILLTEKIRAKLSDFGQAVYQSETVNKISVTVFPNNLDYMPPEVLKPIPSYSSKFDVFSFGCVIIHTVTQELPVPDHEKFVETSKGNCKVYSEIDRRSVSVKKLKNNAYAIKLYNIVLKCLQDDPSDRPAAVRLCSLLKKQEMNISSKVI